MHSSDSLIRLFFCLFNINMHSLSRSFNKHRSPTPLLILKACGIKTKFPKPKIRLIFSSLTEESWQLVKKKKKIVWLHDAFERSCLFPMT